MASPPSGHRLALKQEPPPAPDSVKPLYLVLANTHSTRARQAASNSDDANQWQVKASEWIRLAHTLSSASGDADASDGLAWLESHMLDKSLPTREKATPQASPAVNGSRSLPAVSRSGIDKSFAPESSASAFARNGVHATEFQPPTMATGVDLVQFTELQTQYQMILTQLKSEQAENRILKDRIRVQEDEARALQAAVAASSSSPGQGGAGASRSARDREDAANIVRQAEAERLRLLAVINEERLAKRRAEDAEQEERSVRRRLEDQLWNGGAPSVGPRSSSGLL